MNVITIGIDPNLFALGPFTIAWHGVFTALAVLVGVMAPAWLARSRGLSSEQIYNIALWAVPGGIVGSRVVHVIDYWGFYSANPGKMLAITEGGLAIWGAILGGSIVGIGYAWVKGLPVARYMDLAAFGLILAQATGRIGDVINGEHFADPSGLPWAFLYTHPNSPSVIAGLGPQHPAVLYELLMDLGIFGLLWALRHRPWRAGSLFFLYIFAYSLGRFFLSFLRLDKQVVGGLLEAQVISLIMLAVSLVALAYLFLARAPRPQAAPARPRASRPRASRRR